MNLERDVAPTGFYDTLPGPVRGPVIGPLKKGLLKKVGYDVTSSRTRRRAAVSRAVKKYGKSSTIKKLNAVAVLTRRRSPAKSRKFKADMRAAQKMKGGNRILDDLISELRLLDDGDSNRMAPADIVERAKAEGVNIDNMAVGPALDALKSAFRERIKK